MDIIPKEEGKAVLIPFKATIGYTYNIGLIIVSVNRNP